jgi:ABC-2 type transport system ATP-binding protein
MNSCLACLPMQKSTSPSDNPTLPPAAYSIQVQGLMKRFGPVTAVDDVSFSVRKGEIFGLVGPDGAGKTTVMRILASVLTADAGSAVIEGVDAHADPELIKSKVSYMPQRFGLYEDLTVDENIRFFADLFEVPKKVWQTRAQTMLEASGMTPFRGRLARQLSGGMKQKLGLTCSLVHTPQILLLDEPTTGVDPISRREFWQILYSLRAEGVTILISTAYLDEAERCDRLALLHQGQVMSCDTPANLKAGMPGAMIEIEAEDCRAVRDAIVSLPGVQAVLLIGIGAHVHVDDAQARMPELAAVLEAAGIPVTRMQQVTPSVEDLFVAFLDHNGRTATQEPEHAGHR